MIGRSLDFAVSFEESGPATPMFFILSPGVDPLKDVEKHGNVLCFRVCSEVLSENMHCQCICHFLMSWENSGFSRNILLKSTAGIPVCIISYLKPYCIGLSFRVVVIPRHLLCVSAVISVITANAPQTQGRLKGLY